MQFIPVFFNFPADMQSSQLSLTFLLTCSLSQLSLTFLLTCSLSQLSLTFLLTCSLSQLSLTFLLQCSLSQFSLTFLLTCSSSQLSSNLPAFQWISSSGRQISPFLQHIYVYNICGVFKNAITSLDNTASNCVLWSIVNWRRWRKSCSVLTLFLACQFPR